MLNSGISGFPHAGQMFGNCVCSLMFLISFFRLVISVLIFSRFSFSGWISFTSTLTLYIRSLTCARVWLSSSIVSYILSSTSLLSSSSWVSTALCFFASESILFRNISTGFSKIIAHVIPHRMRVAVALIQKYVVGVMVCSCSFIRG